MPSADDADIVARVDPLRMVRVIALGRAAFGAALAVKTTEMLRLMVRNEEPAGSLFLFARVVGIRDLVLGVGTLAATFGDESDIRRWATTCLASDVADTIAGAADRAMEDEVAGEQDAVCYEDAVARRVARRVPNREVHAAQTQLVVVR